jgi:hypothetical protein
MLVASPPAPTSPPAPPVADCVKLSEPVVEPPTAFDSVTETPFTLAGRPNELSAFPPVADPKTTTGPPEDCPKTAGPAPPFDNKAAPPAEVGLNIRLSRLAQKPAIRAAWSVGGDKATPALGWGSSNRTTSCLTK